MTRPSVIVGVMPPDFIFPNRDTDYWRPFRFVAQNGDDDRNNHYLAVIARLKPDVTFEQARSEMQVIAEQLAAAVSEGAGRDERQRVALARRGAGTSRACCCGRWSARRCACC